MKKGIMSVLVISLLFVACSKKESPEDVAKSFMNEAILNGNFEALKKYATPETVNLFTLTVGLTCNIKKKGLDKCYEELMKKDSSKISKIEIDKVDKINDNQATVYVKEYFKNGKVKTVKLDLVKVDGHWKVAVKK